MKWKVATVTNRMGKVEDWQCQMLNEECVEEIQVDEEANSFIRTEGM